MKEIWKQYKDTNLLVSNLGNLIMSSFVDNNNYVRKERIIKPYQMKTKHLRFKIKSTHYLVHQVVFETFKGEYDKEKYCIHHIDGNPQNNNIENLQLIEIGEHQKLHKTNKQRFDKQIPILQFDTNHNLINEYKSISDAIKDGFESYNISKCIHNKLKTYKGFIWKTK